MKFISILATFALPLFAKSIEDEVSWKGQGENICTLVADTSCFPSTGGFPTCCSTNGSNCKRGARTLQDLKCEPSICMPRVGCYKSKNGAPSCCTQNGGSGCTIYNLPGQCVGGGPSINVCALPPKPKCYKRFGGYPTCCKTFSCIKQGYLPSSEYSRLCCVHTFLFLPCLYHSLTILVFTPKLRPT